MIAPFNDEGNLPQGIHHATWQEICQRFGINIYRKKLLWGLESALTNFKSAGCKKVFLDGSFVTSKYRPNDFDACWDPAKVNLEKLDPVFLHQEDGRRAQKAKYFGEFLPNIPHMGTGEIIIDFFQRDKESGNPKGIICIDLENYHDKE